MPKLPRFNRQELDEIRNTFNLDRLTALDISKVSIPQFPHDYISLSFHHIRGGIGRKGIIWFASDNGIELIIDNHPGDLIGEVTLYKLDYNLQVISRKELLRR